MSPVRSKPTCATSLFIFRPATPDLQPHQPIAPGHKFFTSRFCPEIHIQPIAKQCLNPTSSLSERTQCSFPASTPGDRARHNFFRFRFCPEIRPQPLAAQRLNPTSPQGERTQIYDASAPRDRARHDFFRILPAAEIHYQPIAEQCFSSLHPSANEPTNPPPPACPVPTPPLKSPGPPKCCTTGLPLLLQSIRGI